MAAPFPVLQPVFSRRVSVRAPSGRTTLKFLSQNTIFQSNRYIMILKHFLSALAFVAVGASAQAPVGTLNRADMDLTARPGQDFYQYAGGGWMKAHPLTPEHARYAQFNELEEVNQKRIRTLIEDLAAKPAADGSLAQKIGSLYRLSMDSVRRNREGYEPIRATLDEVRALKDKAAYFALTNRLERCGVSSMIGVGCGADIKNAQMNLVQINQSGLALGERDYYLENDPETRKIREAYRAYVKQLFVMTGTPEAEAAQKMEQVLNIETRIAKASYSATKLRDVEGNYHKMTYAELLRDYPGIDWKVLFQNQGYPAFAEVSVNQPEPIHEVEKILADTPLEALKSYLEFNVINSASSALSDDFRRVTFDFYSRTMQGTEQDRPRWKRAVGTVEDVLGMAVGKMYVERYFPESSKQRMLQLVHNLQKALGQRIDQQTWMSAATKKQAHEKLNTFRIKIGYPDEWRNYDGLVIDEKLSFYENLRRAEEFDNAYEIARRVNKPVDRNEWFMTPQTINAYYDPTTNEICFPAGILQAPFFDPAADDAANYGAIGVVIGHEMTHGFDDQGSQFDKDGNLRNWWTPQDKANFKARTQRMIRFFDGIEVLPGLHCNGALTCGENIADHGGLKVAYQAFRNATSSRPLADFGGFTPDQRFFISYGQIWANNIRPEALRNQVKTDPHAPARWRVNGALPQIEAWYKAFGIKKGDKLFVPKNKRVDIW